MEAAGVKPNDATFVIVINAFAREGRFQDAISMLDEMEAAGFIAREGIYSNLVKAICRKARRVDLLEDLYSRMVAKKMQPSDFVLKLIENSLGQAGYKRLRSE
eukprot:3256171-Amphidinium_carterae.1